MSDHAFLAPSSMGIAVKCTYYPHVNRAYPTSDTLATMEGTAAHYLLEQALLTFKKTGNIASFNFSQWDNTPADNGVFITPEMIGNIKDSYNHITDLIKNQCNFDTMEIEGKVQIPQVHETDCWGTLDFGFYDHDTRTITIRDLKYGFGTVEVYENYQLLLYFLGMLVKHPQAEYFDIGVCQPRPFHRLGNNRSWAGHISEMFGMFDVLKSAIIAIYNNPTTTAGDHCRYCQVNLRCDAFVTSTMNAIDVSIPPNINELTNEQLAKMYAVVERAFNAVKHMHSSTVDIVSTKIDAGERVPGLIIASTMGNSKWAVSDKKAIELCAVIGIDDVEVTKAKTPISVLNSLPKNDPRRKTVEKYLKRNQYSTKLMFDDGREAERVFGKQ